jgi:hypothetical protein
MAAIVKAVFDGVGKKIIRGRFGPVAGSGDANANLTKLLLSFDSAGPHIGPCPGVEVDVGKSLAIFYSAIRELP